ncbi:MAG: hypothetical protein ACJAS1_007367 [Oleiphilaceae bacterium]|jgi:hypothetical protein
MMKMYKAVAPNIVPDMNTSVFDIDNVDQVSAPMCMYGRALYENCGNIILTSIA